MFDVTLFGRTKNESIKVWQISVEEKDGAGVISISHKTGENGKEVKHVEVVSTGKNIGKSNETTPIEQALAQAVSRVNLQLDKGYKREIPEEGDRTGSLGYPLPMLATPINKIKVDLGETFFVSPKLDGFRCLCFKDEDGSVTLYTRKGKEIDTLPHLTRYYQDTLLPGEHVDGELYLHDTPLQKIASLVKRNQPGSELIEHRLYDMISEKDQTERLKDLSAIVARNPNGPISLVEAISATSIEEVNTRFIEYRNAGYEGAMVRLPDAPYEIGARSRSLIKVKGFEERDFRIIGVKLGKPKRKNGTVLNVAILICDTGTGETFDATAPGDEQEKNAAWENRYELIGKMVEIKHVGIIKKTGKPFQPVALKIRDEELE